MVDFVDLERRMATALERLAGSIEDVHPKAELFSSTRSVHSDADDLQNRISELESELEARDAALTGLLNDMEALSTDVSDQNMAIGAITGERDQLAEDIQRLTTENARLTAERDHLRTQTSDTHSDTSGAEDLEIAKDVIAQLEKEQSRLIAMNSALFKASKELRKACESNVVDADMINRNMQASLDALDANEAADAAELNALKAILKPILDEVPNA